MKKLIQSYKGLSREIYVLFIAQVVTSLGFFVQPFLTLLLTQKMAMDAERAGFFVFLSSLVWIPGSLIGGKLADSIGRKKIMVFFYTLSGLFMIPCAFLSLSPVIPWLLIASSFCRGITEPVNDAMISDLTTPEQRKQAFSLLYLAHNMGVALGPMIAGFLFLNHTPWIFLGDGITTLISITLILFFVGETIPKDQHHESPSEPQTEKAERGSLLSILIKRPLLILFMLGNIPLSFVYAQFSFSLPLQMADAFADSGALFYGIVMTVNAVTVVVTTTFLNHWTRNWAPAFAVGISALLFALGFGMISRISSLHWFFISTIIWTFGEILSATNTSVYIANHSPKSHRGRINSLAPILVWSGFGIAPMLSGQLIENRGLGFIWPLTIYISIPAALLFFLLAWWDKKKSNPID